MNCTTVKAVILANNLVLNPSNVFAFFPSQEDAQNNTNEIINLISYEVTATTEIFVKATNSFGCSVIKKIILKVPDSETEIAVLPNVFTPNNDGVNDTWDYSILKKYDNLILMIFDRYGKKVYQHSGASYEWNGKDLSNSKQETGTYYVVYSVTFNGEVRTQSQWLLLKNR